MSKIAIFLSVILLNLHPFEAFASFRFETILSLDQMRSYLQKQFPLGTSKSDVQDHLVVQGKARMYLHPDQPNVEKYVYDINLCKLYVWRWNISANYNSTGTLTQIFMNGEIVHSAGDAPRAHEDVKKSGDRAQILKMKRPRPEARLGKSMLVFLAYAVDGEKTEDYDLFIIGAGPSRADPSNLGKVHVYTNVELWRSIFDKDPAWAVRPSPKSCPEKT